MTIPGGAAARPRPWYAAPTVLAVAAAHLAACREAADRGGAPGETGADGSGGNAAGDGGGARGARERAELDDFLYFIQGPDPEAIAATAFDLVVTDASRDGSAAGALSPAEVAAIGAHPEGGARPVLAYLSIGEAEDYRGYWDPAWDADRDGTPDPGAPAWLGPENPDWPGNYKVRYWDPDWRAIVLGALDAVLAAGFDGAYLDIVDAYYYWGEKAAKVPLAQAARDMIALIDAIAGRARAARPGFRVVPQNGSFLRHDAGGGAQAERYFAAIDGIGIEDAFHPGDADKYNPRDPDREVIEDLGELVGRGLFVLSIEYLTDPAAIDAFYADARAAGFVPFAGRRALDGIPPYPGPR